MKEGSKLSYSLQSYWKSCVQSKCGGTAQQDLSPKQHGQLKMLAKKLAIDGLGGITKEVILHAVEHWEQFGSMAKVNRGLSSYPEHPHIGFLLVHCDQVVNMLFETPSYKANPNVQAWFQAYNESLKVHAE
jgi:hypothetical protein